ncbi:MAG TPA: hypothetical protein VMG30_00855 [Acidobacteriota bacterium]|nr:hypothetical protein [Acidobacteriota bacterium]
MSSLTSSPKRDGFELLRSSVNSRDSFKLFHRPGAEFRPGAALALAWLFLLCLTAFATGDGSKFAPSKAAAAQCEVKLDKLQAFPEKHKAGQMQTQTTKFSESEINSYLALDLSSQYHPCLKSLVMTFGKNHLKATATIDFDRLGKSSTKMLSRLASLLFSGVHTLAADGQLVAKDGKAYFNLDQALFDGSELPKPLVEAIISSVGRKQNPPFDPLKPSEMPYEINKVDVDSGYIIVLQ